MRYEYPPIDVDDATGYCLYAAGVDYDVMVQEVGRSGAHHVKVFMSKWARWRARCFGGRPALSRKSGSVNAYPSPSLETGKKLPVAKFGDGKFF